MPDDPEMRDGPGTTDVANFASEPNWTRESEHLVPERTAGGKDTATALRPLFQGALRSY